jgi:hypothetical protein
MVKTYDILLDIEKELYNPSSLLFSVSRNDFNTIQLNFVITQDGSPLDLTDKTVELAIKKPSGLTIYQTCEVTSDLEGKAEVLLNTQSYIEYGIYTAEVYVRDINHLAVTSPFWCQSRATIMDEEIIESTNEWSALQEALFAYDLRPIVVEGFPTKTPEYIGQMAFDSLNKITYIASDLTSNSWTTFGAVEGGGGGGGGNDTIFGNGFPASTPARIGQLFIDQTNRNAFIAIGATAEDWEQIDNEEAIKQAITWAEVLNKPATFTPEIHTHDWVDIQGKPTTFTPEEHGHEILDVIGLQAELDLKADSIHLHDWNEINNKPLTFTPEAHNHEIVEITGLQASLDLKADDSDLTAKANLADVYTKIETYNKGEVDTIVTGITEGGGTIVEDNLISNSVNSALSANQGRILNETKADINHTHQEYANDSHSHIVAEIEGLQTELDSKADINHTHNYAEILDKPTTFTPEAHTHTKAQITDFAHNHDWAEIDGKPLAFVPEIHTHAWVDITDKPLTFAPETHVHDWVDITGKPATFIPSAHTHTKADITDFAHNHLWADITDKPTTFTPSAHNHAIEEVTGLQGALDSKVDDSNLAGLASTSYVDTADNYIINTLMDGLKLWSGTQAEYDAIGAKSATTLYFITG